jgi:aminoglycoside N3'-acetyltransferase
VAGIGPRASHYCREDHYKVGIWSPESPIGRLVHDGGYLLTLGVNHDTTTAYHVAEVSIPCGCIDPFGNTARMVMPDGTVEQVRGLAFRSAACPVPTAKLHDTLRERGLERYGDVGMAEASLVRAIDLWRARREHIQEVCPTCAIRPNILQR